MCQTKHLNCIVFNDAVWIEITASTVLKMYFVLYSYKEYTYLLFVIQLHLYAYNI